MIEAHTITHTKLSGLSYDAQRREICGSADRLGELYGRRPVLFRPPFGEKDTTTLRAVRDCGMKAAIILMHFRDQFVEDFIAALQGIKRAGLTPARLEDY
ncbi:hypothetical protein GCM10010170_058940 [Dactylosporangium salmoneum]|uniref:NodB homology domain-containing protein n=1 Tax=Dactylosporangium salmoneum TaxID=53361 RepID=A0ABP5TVA4_9ACTN